MLVKLGIICAGCKTDMGEKEIEIENPDPFILQYPVTHSMCDDCAAKIKKETQGKKRTRIPS